MFLNVQLFVLLLLKEYSHAIPDFSNFYFTIF